jgi:F-type H+-transporting ATPase subunit gamma
VPSTREIRRRIRSISSTEQITKAMEMVAASKMRRAQNMALASRPYAETIRDVVSHLMGQTMSEDTLHPLLEQRPVNAIGILLMTADRGLCGALNSNVIRHTLELVAQKGRPFYIIAVGRRGRDFFARRSGLMVAGQLCTLRSEYFDLGDRPSLADASAINRDLLDGFIETRTFDEVYVVYNHFHSTLVQRPRHFRLFPVEPPAITLQNRHEYIYEPSAEFVLGKLLERYIDSVVYHCMRNANENANEIVGNLTLRYNKARQEGITKELLEIASGAQALG